MNHEQLLEGERETQGAEIVAREKSFRCYDQTNKKQKLIIYKGMFCDYVDRIVIKNQNGHTYHNMCLKTFIEF